MTKEQRKKLISIVLNFTRNTSGKRDGGHRRMKKSLRIKKNTHLEDEQLSQVYTEMDYSGKII